MRVAIFTSGRQDWGILEPVVKAMADAPHFHPLIVAGGMHYRGGEGPKILGGFPVCEQVDTLQANDSAIAVAQTAGWTTALLAGALQRLAPDALMLVGDRTETLAAATAAACMRIPILHLHGGEETEGAIDNACRHAITKLAQIHFVAHTTFAARLYRMGEDPSTVIVVGAPSLDSIPADGRIPQDGLAEYFGWAALPRPLLMLTHHPTTLAGGTSASEIEAVVKGVEAFLTRHSGGVIISEPNTDEGNREVKTRLSAFASKYSDRVRLVTKLGEHYFRLLATADAMVGNSSSGILEAASFHLPVVNIGDRQAGRLRALNVIDVPVSPEAIDQGLERACSPAFRKNLAGLTNPYGDGQASALIVQALDRLGAQLRQGNTRKRFYQEDPIAGA